MGSRTSELRRNTRRTIRKEPLNNELRALLNQATYAPSPLHKKHPGDFDLQEPPDPRPTKTLCDHDADVSTKTESRRLFKLAIERGLVSEATVDDYPKQIWVYDAERDQVFEGMYSRTPKGCYHGYPIRKSDVLFKQIRKRWSQ